MKLVFWTSLLLVLYTYAGYPLLLRALVRAREGKKTHPHPVPPGTLGGGCGGENPEGDRHLRREGDRPLRSQSPAGDVRQPSVSVVLAVRNEEARIAARLENLLAQEFDGALEIVVVSDGSTDATCDIVSSFAPRGVRLLKLGSPVGKAAAVNRGVARAGGGIVVFADARQRFERDAVARLAANFRDPSLGCVSGELVFLKDGTSAIQQEMGAYWRYEKSVRRLESRCGSVVGATGAIYAVRRALYRTLPAETLLDDVLTPLNVIEQGYRCRFDGTAVAYDVVSKDAGQEWTRKVRTLAGNWQLIALRPELLLPWANPCWWRLISHKLMRLVVPFLLIAMLASGALLSSPCYRTATIVQLAGYGTALAGLLIPPLRRFRLVKLGYFLLVMNAATVAGCWRWLTGGCASVWQPAAHDGKLRWLSTDAGEVRQ